MDDKSTEFEIQILLDEYKARRNEIDLTLNTCAFRLIRPPIPVDCGQ